ncbi:MAG TPA: DinB family protein [Bryobacteraceae bacterium]|nr:DinB family protein [Bryobacteraceae bacterium]
MSDLIRNHIEYTIWATNRLIEVSANLTPDELHRDFGTADKSIQGTLTHLMRAERTWFRRIHEGTPSIPWGFAADGQWETLAAEWPRIHQDWRDWAAALSDADAEAILDYTDLKGQRWSQPIWQIVLHVVNHATHHRGQISGFLRATGKTPPPLDFIAFVRQSG